jgi:hypothetical protein
MPPPLVPLESRERYRDCGRVKEARGGPDCG